MKNIKIAATLRPPATLRLTKRSINDKIAIGSMGLQVLRNINFNNLFNFKNKFTEYFK